MILTEEEYLKFGTGMTKVELEEFFIKFQRQCVEETLKTLPAVISHLVKTTSTLQSLSEGFYKKNSDLISHKELVRKVIEEVEAGNPGMELDKVLTEAAKLSRERIKIKPTLSTSSEGRPSLESLDSGFGVL